MASRASATLAIRRETFTPLADHAFLLHKVRFHDGSKIPQCLSRWYQKGKSLRSLQLDGEVDHLSLSLLHTKKAEVLSISQNAATVPIAYAAMTSNRLTVR